jgi:hypothetical protein
MKSGGCKKSMRDSGPNRNGGRHRCQPPSAPSLDPPVFASLTVRKPSATRSWLTSSGVASSFWSYPKVGSETFCGPSWVGTSASLAPQGEAANCQRHCQLFRRLFRWSDLGRSPPHRHPVEIGPSVTCRTFLPLPAFWGGGNFRPDHNLNLPSFSESGKRKMRVIACG